MKFLTICHIFKRYFELVFYINFDLSIPQTIYNIKEVIYISD